MMTGILYIDGLDAYTEFGAYVIEGGYNELIAMPPLKDVDYNDWQEEDGIEADLSNPQLNSREISIQFATPKIMSGFISLLVLLSDESYHEFDCRSIGRKYRLRLLSQPNLDKIRDFGFIGLKFADDFPLDGYKYQPPKSNLVFNDDYTLDKAPLSSWGVTVLAGSMKEILKSPTVKSNLTRNLKTLPGAIYDGKTVTYKSKDVKLQCLMRAQTLEELWRNYDAFLFDLIRPEERVLEALDIAEDFPCYYRKCQVSRFYPTGKIWLEFSLTLTFTRDFRISDEPLLATEDGLFVILEDEDGNDYVTLKPDK